MDLFFWTEIRNRSLRLVIVLYLMKFPLLVVCGTGSNIYPYTQKRWRTHKLNIQITRLTGIPKIARFLYKISKINNQSPYKVFPKELSLSLSLSDSSTPSYKTFLRKYKYFYVCMYVYRFWKCIFKSFSKVSIPKLELFLLFSFVKRTNILT